MITEEEKAAIRQKFINHWNTVGIRRHGWIADPKNFAPVVRRGPLRGHNEYPNYRNRTLLRHAPRLGVE